LIELLFLPTFNDLQFKVRTRIDEKNDLTFIGLGAIDLFDLNLGIEDPDEQDIVVRAEYENGNYILTDGGTRYMLDVINNSSLFPKKNNYFKVTFL
jgi:hypothetical protein